MEERQRRIEALRALAGRQERQATDAGVRPRAPRTGRRTWLRLGAAALAIGLIAAVALVWLRFSAHSTARPTPDPLTIRFTYSDIPCPQEAAWSPDGTRVAILGNGGDGRCGNGLSTGSTLAIYSSATWRVLKSIALDPLVAPHAIPQSVRNDPNLSRQAGIGYYRLEWSPNGHQLALSFTAGNIGSSANGGPTFYTGYGAGLLLMRDDIGAARVLLVPPGLALSQPPDAPFTIWPSFMPIPVYRWDLTFGTATAAQVPQALGYIWGQGGVLTPTPALPTTPGAQPPATTTGPVGNPDGGASFTSWQVGLLTYVPACAQARALASLQVPSAWSPDGRYLLVPAVASAQASLGGNGWFAPPAIPGASNTCVDLGQQGNALLARTYGQLPVRDAGLTSAIAAIATGSGTRVGGSVVLAWSHDGRRLAIAPDQTAQPIEIFDCQTGRVLAQLSQLQLDSQAARTHSFQFSTPLWSPDGKRLLLLDSTHAVLFVLGPRSLGG